MSGFHLLLVSFWAQVGASASQRKQLLHGHLIMNNASVIFLYKLLHGHMTLLLLTVPELELQIIWKHYAERF